MNMATNQQQFGAQAYLQPAFQASSVYSLPGLLPATQGSFSQMGTQFLQPESQYLANIRANRIQQENANAAASAQRKAGNAAAIGSMVGLMIGLCWVAREVYGVENKKWTEFRSWLISESPDWLYNAYATEGERYAEFISDKPVLKAVTKFAMNTVLAFNKLKF
jgi:hypothetical protein